MSKTIDEKIVSLQFDNKNFEKNVSQTMTTLDKFKQKLNFSDSGKSLEALNVAAKNVNMSNISSSLDTIHAKFSALDVVAMTTLSNITNRAINTGTYLLKALTLDPIMQGYTEYELQMKSIQTILANTESKGTTLDDVKTALDELNTYADQTIYNFSEMTRNIGTFTAAGVDLEKSVTSIKGIANLAAISGSTSQQASVAMYQLSQALAAGRVQLMDWNSVVNAGMGGEVFQNALKRTATQMGYNVDALIEKYGSFRESLTRGEWLTAEVLTETLTQLSGAYSEADLIAQGYTEEQAKEITQLANTAVEAATKVKTFTQLFDTLKESVGSGWAKTWQLLIGDFEEARTMLTNVNNVLSGFINTMSDKRNNLLESALNGTGESVDDVAQKLNILGISTDDFTAKIKDAAQATGITNDEFDDIVAKAGSLSNAFRDGSLSSSLITSALKSIGVEGTSSYDILTKKINDCGVSTEDFENKIRDLAEASGITNEEFDKIVEETGSIAAAFRKGKLPIDLVVKAIDSFGIKLDAVTAPIASATKGLEEFQNVVNKTINGDFGNGAQRIKELTDAGYNNKVVQDLVNTVWERNGKTWKNTTITSEDLTAAINQLSDAELESMGYTRDQANNLKELAKQAEDSGQSIDELIASLDQRTGRELLVDSVTNILQPFKTILTSIGEAWKDAFPPMTSTQLYNIIKAFNQFTEYLVINEDAANNLTRTLKGLFAVIDLISMVFGGTFKIAFKVAAEVVETLWQALGFGTANILEITAVIGDSLVGLRNWVEQFDIIGDTVGFVVPLILNLGAAFVNLIKELANLPVVKTTFNSFTNSIQSFVNVIDRYFGPIIDKISEFVSTVSNIQGIKPELVLQKFSELIYSIKDSLSDIDLKQVGIDILNGLVLGIKTGGTMLFTAISTIVIGLIEKAKDLLGIHSPSVVFKEIGENIINGLIIGIQNGFDLLKQVGSAIISGFVQLFGDIDFRDIALIGGMAGMAVLVNKLLNIADKAVSPLSGLANVFEALSNTIGKFDKVISAKALEIKSNALLNLAKAIGILAGSIVVLTLVDQSKLLGAILSLGALAGILAALSFSVSKVGDIKSFGKLSIVLLSLGAVLLMMSSVIKTIGSLDPDRAMLSLIGLTGMAAMLGVLVNVMANIGKTTKIKNLAKAGLLFSSLAGALLTMSLVVNILGRTDPEVLGRGLGAVMLIELLFAGLLAVFTLVGNKGKHADKAGSMFLKMSIAIGFLSLTIKALGMMSQEEVNQGIKIIAAFGILFGMLMLVSDIPGENVSKAGNLFMKIGVAVGLLSVALKILGTLSEQEVKQCITVLKQVGLMFTSLFVLSSIMSGQAVDQAGSLFLKTAGAIAILSVALKVLGSLSDNEIKQGKKVLTSCGIMFTILITISNFAGKYADKAGTMLMKMSVPLLALAVIFRLLSGLDPKSLTSAMIFLAGCTVMFGALIAISMLAGENGDKAGDMLMKMAAPIAVLAGAVALLSLLDPAKVAVATTCMTLLVGMLTAAIYASKFATGAMSTLIVLSVAIGMIGGILFLLSQTESSSAIQNAIALSTVLLALSAAMVAISKTGPLVTGSIPALLAVSGALAIIAVILGAMVALDVEPSIETADALSTMLLAMAGVMVVLSALGPLSSGAIAAAGAFDAVVLIIGALMVGLGALVTYIPEVQTFLDSGITVLNSIAKGIGEFAGNLVSGFASGVMDTLPELGSKLSEFMENAQPFFDSASLINKESMEGVQAIAGIILSLTASNVLEAIGKFLTGSSSLEEFGKQLVPFAGYLKDYAEAVSGLDSEVVVNSANAAQTLSTLANDLPNSGGLNAFFNGDNNIDTWGSKLPAFGKALAEYSVAVKDVDPTIVESSATAALALAELNKALPNIGGVVGWFEGDPDIEAFGSGLQSLGKGIMDYYNSVKDIPDFEAISKSVEAIRIISSIYDSLEKLGGVIGWFEGEKSLEGFGEDLKPLGEGLASFYSEISSITDVSKVSDAMTALKILGEIGLDGAQGVAGAMTSLMTLDWSGDMSTLGSGIQTFSNSVSTVNLESIRTAITAITELVNMIKTMDGLDGTIVDGFIAAFNKISGLDTSTFLSTFGGSSEELKAAGQNIITFINSGVLAYEPVLLNTITDILSSVIEKINGEQDTIKTAGTDLIDSFNSGFTSNMNEIEQAIGEMMSRITSSIEGYRSDFNSAGRYLVEGFANGISANSYMASAKAGAMASAAVTAAKKILNEHSPSKVAYKIGDYFGIGFVNGISDNIKTAYTASTSVAEYARKGLAGALSKISSLMTSDIDSNPVIRPVLDLDGFTSDIDSMNQLLNFDESVSAKAALKSISTTFSRNQNGSNDDVVTAIKDLKRSIDDSPKGDSYSIGGVTYEDGGAVSDAVKELIRAIRIEGRK